jgi:5-deoxy-glucuronate isomerase
MADPQPRTWKYTSPDDERLHTVVSPENSPCKVTWLFRLNLPGGRTHALRDESLELSGVVTSGRVRLTAGQQMGELCKHDAFYMPAGMAAELKADEDASLYVGGGPYEGVGEFFIRRLDLTRPLGEVHQVHGEPPYRRTVWMCVGAADAASRLITGLTWGDDGGWTSWPAHQHSSDLEEVYGYFDIPRPKFALHLSYTSPGAVEAVHPVAAGDCVVVPEGYHPTVAMPGVRSTYFWVMVAHSRESRRYDLAVPDPAFET